MATSNKNPRKRISIISEDGTFENTKVEIDGKQLGGGSKKLDSVAFMAERPFEDGAPSYFRFRASIVEKDGDAEKITTLRIANSEDGFIVENESDVDLDSLLSEDTEEEESTDDDGNTEKEDEAEEEPKQSAEDDEKEEKVEDEEDEKKLTPKERAIRRVNEILKG